MKKTKEIKNKLRKRYYELFSRIEKVFDKYHLSNYCEIKNNLCVENRSGYMSGKDCCCSNCKHLSVKGCTIKAISCKLWFCDSIFNKLPTEAIKEIEELSIEARNNKFCLYRGDIEDIFNNECCNNIHYIKNYFGIYT